VALAPTFCSRLEPFDPPKLTTLHASSEKLTSCGFEEIKQASAPGAASCPDTRLQHHARISASYRGAVSFKAQNVEFNIFHFGEHLESIANS
jgi:hypothetical protein